MNMFGKKKDDELIREAVAPLAQAMDREMEAPEGGAAPAAAAPVKSFEKARETGGRTWKKAAAAALLLFALLGGCLAAVNRIPASKEPEHGPGTGTEWVTVEEAEELDEIPGWDLKLDGPLKGISFRIAEPDRAMFQIAVAKDDKTGMIFVFLGIEMINRFRFEYSSQNSDWSALYGQSETIKIGEKEVFLYHESESRIGLVWTDSEEMVTYLLLTETDMDANGQIIQNIFVDIEGWPDRDCSPGSIMPEESE